MGEKALKDCEHLGLEPSTPVGAKRKGATTRSLSEESRKKAKGSTITISSDGDDDGEGENDSKHVENCDDDSDVLTKVTEDSVNW